MRNTLLLIMVICGTGGWMGISQRERIRKLRLDLAKMTAQVQERQSLQEAMRREASRPSVDPQRLNELRQARGELLRLRGEVTLLREANYQSLTSLTNQVFENDRATQIAQEKEVLLLAMEEAKEQARKASNVAVPYSRVIRRLLRLDPSGGVPFSQDELQQRIQALEDGSKKDSLLETLEYASSEGTALGISFDDFEIFYGKSPNANDAPPWFLREKVTRPLPNGRLARLYVAGDGVDRKVREVIADWAMLWAMDSSFIRLEDPSE